MARVVILGAGISGHTAALRLKRRLGHGDHTVTVVSPNANWNWIPSNIWVGVGEMTKDDVVFPLAPVYAKQGIAFVQARATAILPEGDASDATGAVDVEYTAPERAGETERLRYDFLINATGPKLNFGATPGLGPGGNTVSVCTADHAVVAAGALKQCIERMKAGERQTLVIGVGHGTCTCEGAAFEYTFNVEHELREAGVRELADIVYLTNEHELGDFGVGGMVFSQHGFETTSALWTASIFKERGVNAILAAHVERVDPGVVAYELLDGTRHELRFDFAMLLPPFRGNDLKAFDRAGNDVTDTVFAANGFMKVDADYSAKDYDEWRAADWPKTYECQAYPNVFAVGIAFAPPHPISRPRKSPNGTVISPAPPRTGMPSGIMARTVANTIADRIRSGDAAAAHTASMAQMGAGCIASAGTGLRSGSAAGMTMFPVVPDYEKYPTGRDIRHTRGELGLAGHWTKALLHKMFLYKAKAKPFWWMIPE